jgi:hypothetical protein
VLVEFTLDNLRPSVWRLSLTCILEWDGARPPPGDHGGAIAECDKPFAQDDACRESGQVILGCKRQGFFIGLLNCIPIVHQFPKVPCKHSRMTQT